MMHADAVVTLIAETRSRAAQPGVFAYHVEEIAPERLRMTGLERLARAVHGEADETVKPVVDEDDSPDPMTKGLALTSTRFGRRTVLVAPIVDHVFSSGLGRRAIAAAARLRANLESDDARSDLFLFLVCPPGDGDGAHLRRVLERNEALARTHVWVPPSDPDQWAEDIGRFLGRTFLALPVPVDTGTSGDLSPLRNSLVKLVIAGALTEQQAATWGLILRGSVDDKRDVAAELLAAIDGDER